VPVRSVAGTGAAVASRGRPEVCGVYGHVRVGAGTRLHAQMTWLLDLGCPDFSRRRRRSCKPSTRRRACLRSRKIGSGKRAWGGPESCTGEWYGVQRTACPAMRTMRHAPTQVAPSTKLTHSCASASTCSDSVQQTTCNSQQDTPGVCARVHAGAADLLRRRRRVLHLLHPALRHTRRPLRLVRCARRRGRAA
jgi:hypothetical protein